MRPSSSSPARPAPGKGTLIQLVLPRFPELALAVSATTRAQRPGEEDGVHYWFLDRDEFDRRVEAGEFLEWVDFVGNRYGTLRSEIDRLRGRGQGAAARARDGGAKRVKRRVDGRGDDLRDRARSTSSSAGCATVRPRARA